jgi:hypothetical protein
VLGLWLYGFVGLEGAPPELTQARGLGRVLSRGAPHHDGGGRSDES